jgi:hypothetical protein
MFKLIRPAAITLNKLGTVHAAHLGGARVRCFATSMTAKLADKNVAVVGKFSVFS